MSTACGYGCTMHARIFAFLLTSHLKIRCMMIQIKVNLFIYSNCAHSTHQERKYQDTVWSFSYVYLSISEHWVGNATQHSVTIIVRRAGLLWSQQDFEWRWSVPLFMCLTVLEFSFILFDLCLLITFFNFIMNYVPIVTFWIFTYHKIWILSIMFCSIWSYWIIYFLACLEVSWRVVS